MGVRVDVNEELKGGPIRGWVGEGVARFAVGG